MKFEREAKPIRDLPVTRRDDRLKTLYEMSMTLSGDPVEVFNRTVRMVGELLDVPVVCLSEVRGDELYFRSVYVKGEVMVDAGRCPLTITPCATVGDSKDIRIYDRVTERFPEAEFLKRYAAEAYCGFPSLGGDGEVIAVTCLLDDRPRGFSLEDQYVLRVFGQRIATEIERHREMQERRRAEEARRLSDVRLSAIMNMAPEAIVTIGRDNRIQLFNKGAEAIFGYHADEVLNKPVERLLPARFRDAHRKHVAEFTERPETSRLMSRRGEIAGLRKDGSEFPAEASISKLELGDDTIYTVLLHDITERKQAEEEMRTAREVAELADRAKSEFLANVSHELRTPLNAIIGFSDLIESGMHGPVGNPKYVGYAADIKESGLHLLQLINDVLDIAKIEAGNVELHEDDVDVVEIVCSCVRLMTERARGGGVELVWRRPEPALPHLRADGRMLKQILVNLISNAVKFTRTGGAVTVEAGQGADGGLMLRVTDTGIGIAAENIPRALDRFGQVETGLHRRFEGSGLGLPLSKSMVELHGGSLELESALGAGTTVTVRFPPARTVDPGHPKACAS